MSRPFDHVPVPRPRRPDQAARGGRRSHDDRPWWDARRRTTDLRPAAPRGDGTDDDVRRWFAEADLTGAAEDLARSVAELRDGIDAALDAARPAPARRTRPWRALLRLLAAGRLRLLGLALGATAVLSVTACGWR